MNWPTIADLEMVLCIVVGTSEVKYDPSTATFETVSIYNQMEYRDYEPVGVVELPIYDTWTYKMVYDMWVDMNTPCPSPAVVNQQTVDDLPW